MACWPSDAGLTALHGGLCGARAGSIGAARSATARVSGGIVTDLADRAGLFDLVDIDGFDLCGVAVTRKLRSLLRTARDTGGHPLVDA